MRIVPVAHSNHQIQFTSSAGETIAAWHGDGPPVLGEAADVELDIEDRLHWSELRIADAEPGLLLDPEPVVRAMVVAVDEDGVLRLSVGGATLLLETYGPIPEGLARRVVQVSAARVGVWPTTSDVSWGTGPTRR